MPVGNPGSVASTFLADHEEQRHAPLAGVAQASRGRDLGGQDALGVACAAAKQQTPLLTTGKEGGDAVDVRR